MIAILKRKIVDHYRRINSTKGSAEVKMALGDSYNGDWLEERIGDSVDNSGEQFLQNNELGEAIYRCMDKLEDRSRDIFRKKTMMQFETEALCKEFDITPTNLWVIIHRARKAMVNCMEKTWFK